MPLCILSSRRFEQTLKRHSGEKSNKCNQCDSASFQAAKTSSDTLWYFWEDFRSSAAVSLVVIFLLIFIFCSGTVWGPLTLAGIPSIRSFVAKSTNSRNYRLQWPPWVRMGFKVVNLAPISFGGTKPNGKRLTESFHDWGYWDLPLSYWLTQRVFGVRRGC